MGKLNVNNERYKVELKEREFHHKLPHKTKKNHIEYFKMLGFTSIHYSGKLKGFFVSKKE